MHDLTCSLLKLVLDEELSPKNLGANNGKLEQLILHTCLLCLQSYVNSSDIISLTLVNWLIVWPQVIIQMLFVLGPMNYV
jgi:hypothetical protein